MVYFSSVAKSCFMFFSCFQIELVNSKQLECLLKMFFSIQSERGPEKQEQGVCSSEVPPKSVKTSYQGQLFSDQYFETLVSNLSPFFAYFLHLEQKRTGKKECGVCFSEVHPQSVKISYQGQPKNILFTICLIFSTSSYIFSMLLCLSRMAAMINVIAIFSFYIFSIQRTRGPEKRKWDVCSSESI